MIIFIKYYRFSSMICNNYHFFVYKFNKNSKKLQSMAEQAKIQKKRVKIFQKDPCQQNESFNIIPCHIKLNTESEIIIDHTTLSNCCNPNLRATRMRNKIFQPIQEHQSFSLDRTSKYASMCESKKRNHSIFRSLKNDGISSDQDLPQIKQNQRFVSLKLKKTQTEPVKCQTIPTKKDKKVEQIKNYYEQEFQKKLISKASANRNGDDIMKPDQFSKMVKELRSSSRHQIKKSSKAVLRIVDEFPNNLGKKNWNYGVHRL